MNDKPNSDVTDSEGTSLPSGEHPELGKGYWQLTAFQRDLLTTVATVGSEAGAVPYGLEFKRRLSAQYGEEVNHGRLYPNLDDLTEWGYVEKSALDDRTNHYSLSEAGVAVIRQVLAYNATVRDAL